jgi:hypothetical protein
VCVCVAKFSFVCKDPKMVFISPAVVLRALDHVRAPDLRTLALSTRYEAARKSLPRATNEFLLGWDHPHEPEVCRGAAIGACRWRMRLITGTRTSPATCQVPERGRRNPDNRVLVFLFLFFAWQELTVEIFDEWEQSSFYMALSRITASCWRTQPSPRVHVLLAMLDERERVMHILADALLPRDLVRIVCDFSGPIAAFVL